MSISMEARVALHFVPTLNHRLFSTTNVNWAVGFMVGFCIFLSGVTYNARLCRSV